MNETVKMDKFGKIFIPKALRQKLDAAEFEVIFEKDALRLKPIKHPKYLFGTLKKLDVSRLKDVHEDDEHEITA